MTPEASLAGARVATVRDVRSVRRFATAACMVIAPLAFAVIRGLIPYFNSTNGGAGQVAGYAAHPTVYPVIAVAAIVAVVTMWAAMQGVGRLIQGRTPRLALVAVPLATAGWIMVAVLASGDALAYELTGSGVATAAAGPLADRVSNDLFTQLGFSIFINGHLIGTLLLGIGLLLSKRVPAWAGIAVIGGDVLHPVAFLVLHIQPLDALAYVLIAAGMAAAAWAVLATPNDNWDLRPGGRAPSPG
jgi:hypothetical protein